MSKNEMQEFINLIEKIKEKDYEAFSLLKRHIKNINILQHKN
ncbi:hypothetical protein [Clostridium botulinum]|nr:hypothetical protein [Clostridium botulinum]